MSVNYQNANNQLNLLYQKALQVANNAVKEDDIGNVEAAIKSYLEVKKVLFKFFFSSSYMVFKIINLNF